MELFFSLVGYIAAIVVFVEIASMIVVRYGSQKFSKQGLSRGAIMNPLFKETDSYPKDCSWYKQYHREIEEIFRNPGRSSNKWQPLGLWCAPRYQGECINIDKYNLRRTTTTGRPNTSNNIKRRICFFGGSQVWGWGARDTKTIPSYLLKGTNNTWVENHSQLGYVSSQSIITFMQRLKRGLKPDVAVFFGGLNDIYSAYQSGIPDIEQNAILRKQTFDSKISESIFDFYKKKSSAYKLSKRFFCSKDKNNQLTLKDKTDHLAKDIIDCYNQNVDLVCKIASSYNIKILYIWHPTIFDKPHLTAYERQIIDLFDFCKPLYLKIKVNIDDNGTLDKRVMNWSNLFCDDKGAIFIDPWHYNERANDILAEKINEWINGQ